MINRVHQIYNVEPMISHRCGRASYGFIFQELYDKTKDAHVRLKHKRIKLPTDGRCYLPDRIRWFIDRDAPVHCSQFLISKFSRTLDSKNPGKLEHKIIKFDGELQDRRDDRQDELGSDFGTLVGTVSYELEPNIKSNMRNIQKKHRHNLFVKWGPYLHVDYAIRVRVDSASMKFELDIGEEKKSRVETIEVHWTKELNKVVAKNQEIENAREGDGQSSTQRVSGGAHRLE